MTQGQALVDERVYECVTNLQHSLFPPGKATRGNHWAVPSSSLWLSPLLGGADSRYQHYNGDTAPLLRRTLNSEKLSPLRVVLSLLCSAWSSDP